MRYLRAEGNVDLGFGLYLAKFLAFIAMHLKTVHNFKSASNIMKYVTNHPNRFDAPVTAFCLGFTEMLFTFIWGVFNGIILFTRINV